MNLRPSELVALGFAESRQSYVRGVALSREPPKLQQAQPLLAAWDRDRALPPSCDTRCWRAELGMRHTDLLREATAGIVKPASPPCMILQCGIGSKNTCKTFSSEFFDWSQSKKSSFSTGSASRNSQSKKPFFDCVKKPDLGFIRKRPFSTDKSDCVRNGLTSIFMENVKNDSKVRSPDKYVTFRENIKKRIVMSFGVFFVFG